jgi:predicted nucleic-acid-binding protein
VRITADTNVLVRAMTGDDARQAVVAQRELANAELVCIATPALCELVWVLSRGHKIPASEIVSVIRRLIEAENVAVNRPAVEAGLQLLEAGSDFADGVIAYEGEWLGAETFVSFDREAVALLTASGRSARLLARGRAIP